MYKKGGVVGWLLRQRFHLKVALAGDAGETPAFPTMHADIFLSNNCFFSPTTRSDRKNLFQLETIVI